MWENSVIGKLWSFIKVHKKSIFVVFGALWLSFHWVINPFVTAWVALIIPPIAAYAASIGVIGGLSHFYSRLEEKGYSNPQTVNFVLYGTGLLLILLLTMGLLRTVADAFQVNTINSFKFALQILSFILYIGFFVHFRNPKQTQYWAYALAYGLFVGWEWFVDQNVADCTLLNIDAEFTLNYFIILFKEAMLLFIILDTFLKAKEELNQEKRLRNEEKKIC